MDELYSWSRYNTYKQSKYEYFLKYIQKIKEDKMDQVYTFAGSLFHEILERFYRKEIKFEDMIDLFNDGWTTFEILGLKFDRTDNKKNESIATKYKANIEHFFRHHNVLNCKVDLERFITIKIGNYVFQGYIDLIRTDEYGNYIIQDWKSSSIYKGDKIKKESGQLLLYSEGLRQLGVPLDKIKACWNFLKYVEVSVPLVNGKINKRQIERALIGEKLQSSVKTWLKKKKYSETDIEYYLETMLQTNSLDCLPEDIKSLYTIDDCYLYIDINEDAIKELKKDITDTLYEINKKEAEYRNTLDETLFWDTIEEIDKDSYYYSVLSGYSAKLNKPYGAYLDYLKEKEENKNNVFGGVGSDTGDDLDEDDLSWLESI